VERIKLPIQGKRGVVAVCVLCAFGFCATAAALWARSNHRPLSAQEQCMKELSEISDDVELLKKACACIDESGRHTGRAQ